MKKRILTIFTLFLTYCLTSCSKYHKEEVIGEIASNDISKITILALKTGDITTITDTEEITKILETVQSLPLFVKSNSVNTYSTELVQYTIHKTSGEELTVDVLNPWIAYNNVWYACDFNTCTQLSDLAYEYLLN